MCDGNPIKLDCDDHCATINVIIKKKYPSTATSCSLDLVLLWPWRGLAATAPIRPLTWVLTYAAGAAVKRKKEREKERCLNRGLMGE